MNLKISSPPHSIHQPFKVDSCIATALQVPVNDTSARYSTMHKAPAVDQIVNQETADLAPPINSITGQGSATEALIDNDLRNKSLKADCDQEECCSEQFAADVPPFQRMSTTKRLRAVWRIVLAPATSKKDGSRAKSLLGSGNTKHNRKKDAPGMWRKRKSSQTDQHLFTAQEKSSSPKLILIIIGFKKQTISRLAAIMASDLEILLYETQLRRSKIWHVGTKLP